jgi:hypothetical protein
MLLLGARSTRLQDPVSTTLRASIRAANRFKVSLYIGAG